MARKPSRLFGLFSLLLVGISGLLIFLQFVALNATLNMQTSTSASLYSNPSFRFDFKTTSFSNATTSTTTTTTTSPQMAVRLDQARRISKRIDFSNCPTSISQHATQQQQVVAAEAAQTDGMGHRMIQNFFMIRYALTNGYCFCFDAEQFGADVEAYHLLLEPVFPSCKLLYPTRTFRPTNLTEMQSRTKSLQETNPSQDSNQIIHWVKLDNGEVWPFGQQQWPRGLGDVLSFMDSFLRDNRLVDEVIIPWYRQHKNITSAFRRDTLQRSTTAGTTGSRPATFNNVLEYKNHDVHTRNVLTASFHIRVGDIVLDSSKEYWRNVLSTMLTIVDMEYDPSYSVEIYLIYFPSRHRRHFGKMMRATLAQNVAGEWPSKQSMLPASHQFLGELCQEMDRVQCLWKDGTNIHESIDLFVESDLMYVSGSSFSQVLSLFNRGIRLVAITKELNQRSAAFLKTSTSALSSLQYYYIDTTGGLYNEQYTYLKLNPPNQTR